MDLSTRTSSTLIPAQVLEALQIPNLPLEQLMLESSGTWRRFAQGTATGPLISNSLRGSPSSLAPSRNLLNQLNTSDVLIRDTFCFNKIGKQTILNYTFQEKQLLNSKSTTSSSTQIPPSLSHPTQISLLWRLFRTPSITSTHMSSQSPKFSPRHPVAGTLPHWIILFFALISLLLFFFLSVRDELCCFLQMF